MSQICIEWSRIGYDCDPVPGNPDGLEEGSALYKRTAKTLDEGADSLGKMIGSTSSVVSEAMDELSLAAGKTRTAMSDLHTRYAGVGGALAKYAPALRKAQQDAASAAQDALAAQRVYNQHSEQYRSYANQMWTLDDDARNRYQEMANTAAAQAGVAKSNYGAALSRIQVACSERDAAATEAANTIKLAIDASELNDTLNDHIDEILSAAAQVITDVAVWVWNHLDEIALALDAITLILLFIPGVNVAVGTLRLVQLTLRAVSITSKSVHILKAGKDAIDIYGHVSKGEYAQAGLVAASVGTSMYLKASIGSKAGKFLKSASPHKVTVIMSKATAGGGMAVTRETVRQFASGVGRRSLRTHFVEATGNALVEMPGQVMTSGAELALDSGFHQWIGKTMTGLGPPQRTITCGVGD